MAIQISEHKLSEQARKALNNSKNKSQFLRDAIEYYVRRDQNTNTDAEIKKDIKEIKDILLQFSSQPSILESAITDTSNSEIIENTNNSNLQADIKIGNDDKNEFEHKEHQEPKKEVEEDHKKDSEETSDNNMTDKEKKEIEAMIDASIDWL